MPATNSSTVGVYVSIPFCRAKCSYCNFASGVFSRERMSPYVDIVVQEIRGIRRNAQRWSTTLPSRIDTIYFGGGTPSLLSPAELDRILQALHEVFEFSSHAEITLECAPGQLSDALLSSLPQLGFNRVSLGVQSFVDRETSAVGRLHTRTRTLQEIARLRGAGIHNINVDLIAGLPHQTPESWQASIHAAISTGVPHLSVYMLDVDEDSRLGRELQAGGTRYHAGHVPDEESIAAMYTAACEQFHLAEIEQYEISNFARPGSESRHNLKYWTRRPYIGFGLDAHSFLPAQDGSAMRISTTDNLTQYLLVNATEVVTPVSPAEAIEETWFLGLRLASGVSLSRIESQFGLAAVHAFLPALLECERDGFIEHRGDNARLTARGRLFANEVFQRFIGISASAGNAVETDAVLA